MSTDNWFRFPIGLLAIDPNDAEQTLGIILAYCLSNVGGSNKALEITDAKADQIAVKKNIKAGRFAAHRRIIRGAHILNVFGGHCEVLVRDAKKADAYLSKLGSAARVQVNVSAHFFWRALNTARGSGDGEKLSWRDFRFLCALLSKIGTKKYSRCGWREIQARAAGWSGKSDLRVASPAEYARRAPLILSEDQIRKTRDELEAGNFFCRFVYRLGRSGGESWYSFSTNFVGESGRAILCQWVCNGKSALSHRIKGNRTQDNALIEAYARRHTE